MNANVRVDDYLSLSIGPHVVQLEANEALELSADLARRAFRRIATEEHADFLFDIEIEPAARTEQ